MVSPVFKALDVGTFIKDAVKKAARVGIGLSFNSRQLTDKI